MTLNGAIKQLNDLRNDDSMPVYFKLEIAAVINTLLMDAREDVKGEWLLEKDGWYCSACEEYSPLYYDPKEVGIPYCPWCGARMEE